MTPRIHVPFDNWAMPVDVQVSQLVRVGDLAWSCGQCPLDEKGNVLSPGDLIKQAEIVCDYIEAMLPRADLANHHVAQLVVYYVHGNTDDTSQLEAVFRKRFGDLPLIVPIAVPHFYYPGLMIEVDVYASAVAKRLKRKVSIGRSTTGDMVDGGQLAWVKFDQAFPSNRQQGNWANGDWISTLSESYLAQTWIFPREQTPEFPIPDFDIPGLMPDVFSKIDTCNSNEATGLLTMSSSTITDSGGIIGPEGETMMFVSSTADILTINGRCQNPELSISEQTKRIMKQFELTLKERGLSFDHVVKLNAHYVGSPSPEDLHENLKIRHSYYGNPGPASTGLPVAGLHHPDAKIAIDIIAVA